MFSTAFLHTIREAELDVVVGRLPAGAAVLELGGGTGCQARELQRRGYRITSVDLPDSHYRAERVFPVLDYDGVTLPFEDGRFDVVYSSSVLEHVADPARLHREIRRVLKPGGFCLHVLPCPVWRFWTSIAHYVELARRCGEYARTLAPRRMASAELDRLGHGLQMLVTMVSDQSVPPRHGEVGSSWSELRTFSRPAWRRYFERHGFRVVETARVGLFYTGHMVLGPRWSLDSRRRWAGVLGSACLIYRVEPKAA